MSPTGNGLPLASLPKIGLTALYKYLINLLDLLATFQQFQPIYSV